jgi:hypothetical protein
MRKADEPEQKELEPTKQPIDMTSDELLEYALERELAAEVQRVAKPPEDTDSERDC